MIMTEVARQIARKNDGQVKKTRIMLGTTNEEAGKICERYKLDSILDRFDQKHDEMLKKNAGRRGALQKNLGKVKDRKKSI